VLAHHLGMTASERYDFTAPAVSPPTM
jgi:hypothetical protein